MKCGADRCWLGAATPPAEGVRFPGAWLPGRAGA